MSGFSVNALELKIINTETEIFSFLNVLSHLIQPESIGHWSHTGHFKNDSINLSIDYFKTCSKQSFLHVITSQFEDFHGAILWKWKLGKLEKDVKFIE